MSDKMIDQLVLQYREAAKALADGLVEAPLMQGFPAEPHSRVTWDNWIRPPFNRWALRNMSSLRPTIDVKSGNSSPDEWVSAPRDLDTLPFESIVGEPITVAQHLQATKTDGFLVLRKGELLYEQYFNGQQRSDRHIMFSVTKSLIGLLGEHLVSSGALTPESFAQDYVAELAGSAFADATVQQLFDMAVGVAYNEVYDDPASECSQYGYACGLLPAPSEFIKFESLYEFLPSLKKLGEHGQSFCYVTATTEVLAWVIERASGLSCSALLERVWSRLNCDRDGYFIADPWGRSVAGGGFNATLRDMARFGQLILDGGKHRGEQLIALDAIERVLRGGDPQILAHTENFSVWTPGASYRSQWYVFNDHSQAVMAGGIHGQYLFVDIPSNTVIVKQSSLPEAVTDFDVDSVRMMRTIAKSLYDE